MLGGPSTRRTAVASVSTRTNGVNACTDAGWGDAEWVFSAPSRNGLKSRREDLVHRVCAAPIFAPHRFFGFGTLFVWPRCLGASPITPPPDWA